jgi:hypothetical protein
MKFYTDCTGKDKFILSYLRFYIKINTLILMNIILMPIKILWGYNLPKAVTTHCYIFTVLQDTYSTLWQIYEYNFGKKQANPQPKQS